MIRFVRLSETDFATYAAEVVPAYAADKIASGQWTISEAPELARKALLDLLPQGLETPDHFVYHIRHDLTQATVGTLWIAKQKRSDRDIIYIYDIRINPSHQGRGYGTEALRALEDLSRSLGVAGIGLHVFGHNAAAHTLYTKLGYKPTDIIMFKPLSGAELHVDVAPTDQGDRVRS